MVMEHLFPYPKIEGSFLDVLSDPLVRRLLGHEVTLGEDALPFITGVTTRLEFLLRNPLTHLPMLKTGYSCLEAFLQSNATGPPLDFNSEEIIIPNIFRADDQSLANIKREMFQSLNVDGDATYALTPNIELFWLANTIMSHVTLAEEGFNGRRARFRVAYIHQRLLLEQNDTLQEQIYSDAEILEDQLSSRMKFHGAAAEEHFVEFLIERASIYIFYGDDARAREDLARAAKIRQFQFALTGALGKRTRFQHDDISQLVVLAKSRDYEPEPYASRKSSRVDHLSRRNSSRSDQSPDNGNKKPENLALNDDTLLESIAFKEINAEDLSKIQEESSLPPVLTALDPANQPLLFPVDSIILLITASSISNTSPSDGLTREQTLPYAIRVLEGGSSNWQVYTQALLVRSRVEGYSSRTAERGLLQLQAVVDQIIAELASSSSGPFQNGNPRDTPPTTTTFLPRSTSSQAATAAERLRYIYQICPPLRWELESELASRWVSIGGLKTALEIYERLGMRAEVALCLAATDQEAEAIRTIRKMLFEPTDSTSSKDDATITSVYSGPEISPLPPDAPRLFSILGDLENNPNHYMRAWTVSKGRYARAQRSLGQYYVLAKKFAQAAEAYTKSLEINRLNANAWFALGSIQLTLEDWRSAVQSFTRMVQLQDDDGEAWSNLAVALLKLSADPSYQEEEEEEEEEGGVIMEQEDEDTAQGMEELTLDSGEATKASITTTDAPPTPQIKSNSYRTVNKALSALRRAAQLKRDDARIWDNYLTVAASIPPPATPWPEIIQAQRRVIELRGKSIGEKAADEKILAALIGFVTSEFDSSTYTPSITDSGIGLLEGAADAPSEPEPIVRGNIPSQLISLVDQAVIPLITSSSTLWLLVARLARWRHRPLSALEAHEKAWRALTSQPGIYDRDEQTWNSVAAATETLVKAYQELGLEERERTGGKVASDWRFKARSAVRTTLGKGRVMWDGSDGCKKLEFWMGDLQLARAPPSVPTGVPTALRERENKVPAGVAAKTNSPRTSPKGSPVVRALGGVMRRMTSHAPPAAAAAANGVSPTGN